MGRGAEKGGIREGRSLGSHLRRHGQRGRRIGLPYRCANFSESPYDFHRSAQLARSDCVSRRSFEELEGLGRRRRVPEVPGDTARARDFQDLRLQRPE